MGYERQILRSDMINCALCEDAPCREACGRVECDKALRSIWCLSQISAQGMYRLRTLYHLLQGWWTSGAFLWQGQKAGHGCT